MRKFVLMVVRAITSIHACSYLVTDSVPSGNIQSPMHNHFFPPPTLKLCPVKLIPSTTVFSFVFGVVFHRVSNTRTDVMYRKYSSHQSTSFHRSFFRAHRSQMVANQVIRLATATLSFQSFLQASGNNTLFVHAVS